MTKYDATGSVGYLVSNTLSLPPSPSKDTAGEEKYASLSAFYCRGASVAVLAFDLTSLNSFHKLRDIFIPLLQDSVDNCLTVVVGTKLDLLETEEREVRRSDGEELAIQQHQFQLERALKHTPNTFLKDLDGSKLYYETSSKTGKGVDKLFEDIQRTLLADLEKAGTGTGAGAGAARKASAKGKGGGGGSGTVQLGEQTDGSTGGNKSSCCS